MKKKNKPNINNLSTEARFSVGDMVVFCHYKTTARDEHDETESHGIVISATGSLVRIRPLRDFSRVELCNAADCRLASEG
jgi:hypothetical protein